MAGQLPVFLPAPSQLTPPLWCRRPHKRLLPPAYFAQASNQAEQFMYFSSLVSTALAHAHATMQLLHTCPPPPTPTTHHPPTLHPHHWPATCHRPPCLPATLHHQPSHQAACVSCPVQAAWLLQQCGLDVPNPKDHEDPHGICATIMAAARRLGFAPPSYAPTKLTGGWGREVCALLWALADAVIARRRVAPARPVYRQESERGEAEGDGADQGSEVGWGAGVVEPWCLWQDAMLGAG